MQGYGLVLFLKMWITMIEAITFTESADHFKYDFYLSTWHIPCEYLHP